MGASELTSVEARESRKQAVRGVERGEVPEPGGHDRASDSRDHRQGAFCCSLPTPRVPQLSGHSESGKTPRLGSSEQGLSKSTACGHQVIRDPAIAGAICNRMVNTA